MKTSPETNLASRPTAVAFLSLTLVFSGSGCQTQRSYDREQEAKIAEYQKAYEEKNPDKANSHDEGFLYGLGFVLEILGTLMGGHSL